MPAWRIEEFISVKKRAVIVLTTSAILVLHHLLENISFPVPYLRFQERNKSRGQSAFRSRQ
jgi:hypothetical protein